MSQTVRGVLKRTHVRLAGPKAIGAPAPATAPDVSARVVRRGPGDAVVEVTCACGTVIHLRCLYDAGAPGQPLAPEGETP
ncbi:MAG TPA: hypothetical protein VM695_11630 [Phycisphaerae bacterium]|nr:hypothetical protein [Phycisphaerae bacterium]